MSFSSFIPNILSPLTCSFPAINACIGFNCPWNILRKSSESKIMVQPASPPGKDPLPTFPVIVKEYKHVDVMKVKFGSTTGPKVGL